MQTHLCFLSTWKDLLHRLMRKGGRLPLAFPEAPVGPACHHIAESARHQG